MSRELATVFVQFIPAGNWQWDQDNFDYLIVGNRVVDAGRVSSESTFDAENNAFSEDAYGIGLSIIGLQSSEVELEYDSRSILRCLYDGGGPCDVYDEDTATRFVEIAQALRGESDNYVLFVVAFDCDVEDDSYSWITNYADHGEPYATPTHYCNSETLEWIQIDA